MSIEKIKYEEIEKMMKGVRLPSRSELHEGHSHGKIFRTKGEIILILTERTVKDFVEVLASNAPAPGGGSVAALSGALGAALVGMVCRLTIGKIGYEEHDALMKETLKDADEVGAELLDAVQKDTEAFDAVMAAFALPKDTDAEKEARKEAIQEAYKGAIASPQGIMMMCLRVLSLADRIVEKCNKNALSDVGVGAFQALAGFKGAVLNVKINLPSIKDIAYTEAKRKWLTEATAGADRLFEEINKKL